MPSVHIPKLCRHKAKGQAYVTLPGTRTPVYSGLYGTAASEADYRRFVAELRADSLQCRETLKLVACMPT